MEKVKKQKVLSMCLFTSKNGNVIVRHALENDIKIEK